MPKFFSRPTPQRLQRLSLRMLMATAPVVALPATAQTAPHAKPNVGASTTSASSGTTPDVESAPRLTGATNPASAIAISPRAVAAPRQRAGRLLLVSKPDAAPLAVAPPKISVPQRVRPLQVTSSPKTSSPATVKAIVVAALAPDPSVTSARSGAARLPARGGMIFKPSPVELRPEKGAAPAMTPTQRLLLARLDADLARAQRRLNRAESRLSEGQRQLGSFTGVLRSAMLEADDGGRGLHPFVRVAQRYLGTPYVWGGENARGFDCSGFIMRVMRDLGYSALPHSAAEQFRYGMPVAKEALKAGDIVFFANTYKPGVSHVGIYLGRGRFIHAANSQDGTIVSSLDQPKWVEKYAGARRLLPVKSSQR